MLRFFYVVGWLLVFLLRIEPNYRKVKRLEREGKIAEKDAILKSCISSFGVGLLKAGGAELEVEGVENLPPQGEPFIIVPNHQSMFDIPILFRATDRLIGFVSKKENMKLPFIGRWISVIYSVFIDRTSARDAVKSLEEGVKMVKRGYPQVIFPEGTRTQDGTVAEFKPGSLKLAQKAGCPVVPIAIFGSMNLHKKSSIKITPGPVKVKIFEAISLEDKTTSEAAALCHSLISDFVEKNRRDL